MAGKLEGPSEEEIRDNGDRGRRVGLEPLDYWDLKLRESADEGIVSSVAELPDVFDAGRDLGV